MGEDLRLERARLQDVGPVGRGLIATNPPYGVRIRGDLPRLYEDLGTQEKR